MKKKKILLYVFLTGVLLFSGFMILLFFQTFHLPVQLDKQHYNTLLTDGETAQGYALVYLYRYPQTNYLLAKYVRREVANRLMYQDRFAENSLIVFVDLEQKKRILSVEHDSVIQSGKQNTWRRNTYSILDPQFVRRGDEVLYLFTHTEYSGIDIPVKTDLNPLVENLFKHAEYEGYAITPTGTVTSSHHSFFGGTAIPGTNYVMQGGTYTPVDEPHYKKIFQLESEDNILPTKWLEPFPEQQFIYTGNNTFLSFSLQNYMTTIFVLDESVQNRNVDFQDLIGSFEIEQVQIFYPLTTGRYSEPAMLLITTSEFHHYVYEVHNQNMLHDSMEDMFHKVYMGEEPVPFAVLNQNRVMMLKDDINLNHEITSNTGSLYYTLREEKEDGSLGGFETELYEIEVPNIVELISKHPFDDEHLLLYGNDAVWTVKWDGTEFERIFPQ